MEKNGLAGFVHFIYDSKILKLADIFAIFFPQA
jgi:hypothetical protein